MRSLVLSLVILVFCLTSTLSSAQAGFFSDWFSMVSETQAVQPHWITPLATTIPRLEQEFRYDIQWRTHNTGQVTDNYGVSRGLEIIPAKNVEVVLAYRRTSSIIPILPMVSVTGSSWSNTGSLLQTEEHGNYILTAFFQMSLPTGQYEQGALNPVITPTLAEGEGL
jgi:hypothetical protein